MATFFENTVLKAHRVFEHPSKKNMISISSKFFFRWCSAQSLVVSLIEWSTGWRLQFSKRKITFFTRRSITRSLIFWICHLGAQMEPFFPLRFSPSHFLFGEMVLSRIKDDGRFVYFGFLSQCSCVCVSVCGDHWAHCTGSATLLVRFDCTMICIVHAMVDMSKHTSVFIVCRSIYTARLFNFDLSNSHWMVGMCSVHTNNGMKVCSIYSRVPCKMARALNKHDQQHIYSITIPLTNLHMIKCK